ncbi:MAG: hypothetical protein CMH57_16090 [Myxococcales bacterium]|nr:hypothetical protein [Myxococcales bacterium]
MNLRDNPFFAQLDGCERILLAGMGGGFDLYCGLPLYFALRGEPGREVHLANLTFANTRRLGPRLSEVSVEVNADSGPPDSYFPERHFCAFMRERYGEEVGVVCVERGGEVQVREAYRRLAERLELDAIVLVDGGTDSLMRGDEAGLGTPHEDALSLVAVASEEVGVEVKLMASLGFGIDAFHGVCHAHMLENVAALMQEGAFLGTVALLPQMEEARRYMEAVDYANACTPNHESIVNNSIVSALEGAYGDVHRTRRTEGGELWINPLMLLYWTFQLKPVAERLLYADVIRGTTSFNELIVRLEAYEAVRPRRDRVAIPV